MVSVQIDKGVPDEAVTLASIEGVGERSMEVLMKNGIRSLRDAGDRKPEDLIRMGIRGQIAIEIVESAKKLPRIEADLSSLPKMSKPGTDPGRDRPEECRRGRNGCNNGEDQ